MVMLGWILFFLLQGFCNRVTALPDFGDFFWEKAPTPILDMVDSPIHLKNLSLKVFGITWLLSYTIWVSAVKIPNSKAKTDVLNMQELKQLANEIRSEISFIMSRRCIPFKASLAVVELTVAIHHVFHAPMDKILWDVGEQVQHMFLYHQQW